MNTDKIKCSPEQQLALEQFYYCEARLLDSRQFQQWLGLLSEDIQYIVPSRHNPLVDNRKRGNEDMLSVEWELDDADSMGCPLREENLIHLTVRVERAYKMNSWAENPPARTRRIVGNVELLQKNGERLSVISNFHLHYSRPGCNNTLYSGQRRDTLIAQEDSYKIAHRVVVMDYSTIEAPTMGLLF
ncbi:MAG: aromatic-ring-hydroxylating dioxygenase subunit beta [Gammaproteobacteria bacterium]|nr:aromatic-ring-hydroxylating dioxygenase subunit beta [Gammaproteobacteria bacterium]